MVLLANLPFHICGSHVKRFGALFTALRIGSVRVVSRSMSSSEAKDVTAAPAANQRICHDGKDYTTIKEGLAYILVPLSASSVPQTSPKGENEPQSVFYNPIQQFNRDLSVLAIKAYGEEVIGRKRKEMETHNSRRLNKSQKRKRLERGEDSHHSKSAKVDAAVTNDAEKKFPPVENPVSIADEMVINQVETLAGTADYASPNTENKDHVDPIDQEDPAPNSHKENTISMAASNPKRNPTFKILDALSATGLRALRYAHEIPFTTFVTANDLLKAATATIDLNVQHNGLSDKIKSITGNAVTHMYGFVGEDTTAGKHSPSAKYDVIDLDPYGTAATFLDAAVQAVRDDGGLLCVTCTDSGVWASNGYPEKSYSLYGGIPIKGLQSHEGGLRLILHSIASSAARYGLAIEPLLSLSIDYYARVFVRIRKSPEEVKFLAGKTMLVYNCDSGCGAWNTQLLAKNKLAENKKGGGTFYKHVVSLGPTTGEYCEHCGTKTHLAGPMYAGPLHSTDFIRRILDDLPKVSKETYGTLDRIEGMLNLALEENLEPLHDATGLQKPARKRSYDATAIDYYPFYFIPSALSKIIHCVTPHENAMRGALRHLGYRVTRSHAKAGSIKTDAPWSVIWEVMREWVKQKAPIKDGAVTPGTPGWRILGLDKADATPSRENRSGSLEDKKEMDDKVVPEIVFDEELGKERDAKKLLRYQVNPRENWGPMNRAKGH